MLRDTIKKQTNNEERSNNLKRRTQQHSEERSNKEKTTEAINQCEHNSRSLVASLSFVFFPFPFVSPPSRRLATIYFVGGGDEAKRTTAERDARWAEKAGGTEPKPQPKGQKAGGGKGAQSACSRAFGFGFFGVREKNSINSTRGPFGMRSSDLDARCPPRSIFTTGFPCADLASTIKINSRAVLPKRGW